MPGQHVLHPAEVDVAVDLGDVVGRAGHVVLDEVAALEHGDLGGLRVDVDAHEVAPDRAGPCARGPGGPRGCRRRGRCRRWAARPGRASALPALAAVRSRPLAGALARLAATCRRRRRRDRGRRGGAGAWPGRRRCPAPAPPGRGRAAAPVGRASSRRSAGLRAGLGGRPADQRGVGGLDGLGLALPGRVGQLGVAVVAGSSPASPRRRRLGARAAAVAAAAGAAAAALGGGVGAVGCRRRSVPAARAPPPFEAGGPVRPAQPAAATAARGGCRRRCRRWGVSVIG